MRRLALGLASIVFLVGCRPNQGVADPERKAGETATSEASADGDGSELAAYIQAHYDKREVEIPMRDGVKLFTSIYAPKNADSGDPQSRS